MLTKFPVTTDRGEYRVTIRESRAFERTLVVRIYVKTGRNIPAFRFEKIGRYLVSTDYWYANLIGLAKTYVLEAERSYLSREVNPLAIEAFRNWDGDMTTKEESR
ncbi:hypothetical protein KM908_14260 [Alkalihalobacillus clausii]|uniref:hypothetical protein n=1 Tax=Shouchella clausii TaxID=79880 RepID=UPI001C2318D7|nr:hypothetical protein [Shouchella clausii]MBU8597305.1 hypothetical protein [Shouchella clausii]